MPPPSAPRLLLLARHPQRQVVDFRSTYTTSRDVPASQQRDCASGEEEFRSFVARSSGVWGVVGVRGRGKVDAEGVEALFRRELQRLWFRYVTVARPCDRWRSWS